MASKQMSLADLAKKAKPVQNNNTKEIEVPNIETEEVSNSEFISGERPTEVHSSSDHIITPHDRKSNSDIFSRKSLKSSNNGVKKVSSNELMRTRIASGEVKPVKEEIGDAPVVDAAFKSMINRLQESKNYIENVVKPIVMQNAEEIALENASGTLEQSMKEAELEMDQKLQEANESEIRAAQEHSTLEQELREIDMFDINSNNNRVNDNSTIIPSNTETEPTVQQNISDFAFEEDNSMGKNNKVSHSSNLDELEAELNLVQDEPQQLQNDVTEVTDVSDLNISEPESNNNETTNTTNEITEVTELPEEKVESHNNIDKQIKQTETKFAEMPSTTSLAAKYISDSIPTNDQNEIVDNEGNKSSINKLMEDLDKDENEVDESSEETSEEVRERFKKVIDSTQIITNKADLKHFQIRKKPVSSAFILSQVQNNIKRKYADWAMYHSKVAARFSEAFGPELDNLRKTMNASNQINRVISSLKFLYDHTIDANKPDFETWCKLRRTEDIENGYYGIYRATYYDSNLVARTCDHCKKMSLIETNIDDMVTYGTEKDDHDKIKQEFQAICNGDTSSNANVFKATLIQISDDFVAAYTPASFYSTFIQYSTLKDTITQKYSDLLDIMAYIDSFYYIDRNTNELVLVDIKHYPGDIHKEVISRLQTFTGILKTLTVDQYSAFTEKLNNIFEPSKILYKFPAVKCPECGHIIPEARVESMLQLLFTRAQLARIRSL